MPYVESPWPSRSDIERLVVRHTLQLDFEVPTSTGLTKEYFDGIGLVIHNAALIRAYFDQRLGNLWPLATGASGAAILGVLGRGSLWQQKDHGIEWYGLGDRTTQARSGALQAALVDDCRYTGSTLERLRTAALRAGWFVRKQIVIKPYCE